ncbi:MAG: ferrous iron transport protein A [Eubacterium sp.]|nr:ferrous iron transport protein A [Eubacterium sp.]
MMPILMTQTGDNVKVAKIIGNDAARQRLGELGFVAGTEVSVVQSHGGDMIVKIRDSRLALTREMAAKIMVDPLQ